MSPLRKQQVYPVLTALVALVLVFSLFLVLYRKDNKYTAGPPYGEAGVFAFSVQDLNRPLFLIDGWEVWLDEAFTPSMFAAGVAQPPQEAFIGQYSNFSYYKSGHAPFGSATYRMRLAYDGSPRPLTLEIPELYTDYTLWVDEQPVAQNGVGRSVTFIADRETQLVFNVQNRTHYYSGMTYPPALGTPEAIGQMFWARDLFYAALFFCSLTLAVFSCVLWLTRERGLFLPFGLLCLFFAISCLHPFVWQLGLSGRLWYAMEDTARLAVLACITVICSEVAGFTGNPWYRRIVRPATIGVCLFAAISVALIIPAFPNFINPYAILLLCVELLAWLYLIACAVAGVGKNAFGSQFVLAGGLVLGASTLLNLADSNRFEPIYTGWQSEYAGALLVLIFSGLMIARNRVILQKNRQLMLHMEDLVEQRTAELHQVLEERKAFFSDLAHNLKAPIAAIHVFIDMMRESNLYLDRELGDYLHMIENENVEMQQRVQSLRTLNAFDRIGTPNVAIDLDDLLGEVVRKNRPEADAAGIHLIVGRLGVAASIHGQREKLLVLFENLIYNAISFTPIEGSISIQPYLEGSKVIITVSDTGSGIAAEHLPHIFERFYVGRENKNEGSGLGLYIAKLTVEELGGSISAHSTQEEGTTFTIRLPLSAPTFFPLLPQI